MVVKLSINVIPKWSLYSILILFIIFWMHNLQYFQNLLLDNRDKCLKCKFSTSESVIFVLSKPLHRFHGNHWFHVGEYYLSRKKKFLSLPIEAKHVSIVAYEPKLSKMMTKFSFFLLLLSIYRPEFQTVSLFHININSEISHTSFDFLSNGPKLLFNSSSGIKNRIIEPKHIKTNYNPSKSCFCGKTILQGKSYPVNSSEWFSSQKEVSLLRKHSSLLCAGSNALYSDPQSAQLLQEVTPRGGPKHGRGGDLFTLVVYQRDSNRKMKNLLNVLQSLAKLPVAVNWRVQVLMHSEETHPCFVHNVFQKADILFTTHGFQVTALMFLRPGSFLIEIFPYKYYKESYFPLAARFGINHRWVQNPEPTSVSSHLFLGSITQESCMANMRCRSFARGRSVALPKSHVDLLIQTMTDVQTKTEKSI